MDEVVVKPFCSIKTPCAFQFFRHTRRDRGHKTYMLLRIEGNYKIFHCRFKGSEEWGQMKIQRVFNYQKTLLQDSCYILMMKKVFDIHKEFIWKVSDAL